MATDHHRFYQAESPAVGDCVVCSTDQLGTVEVKVRLLEYGALVGFASIGDCSFQSGPGQIEMERAWSALRNDLDAADTHVAYALKVVRIEGDRIELSGQDLTQRERLKAAHRYKKSKQVHSLLMKVAATQDLSLAELYRQVGWPLYRDFKHGFNAFPKIANDPSILDRYGLDPAVQNQMVELIQERMSGVRLLADAAAVWLSRKYGTMPVIYENYKKKLFQGILE